VSSAALTPSEKNVSELDSWQSDSMGPLVPLAYDAVRVSRHVPVHPVVGWSVLAITGLRAGRKGRVQSARGAQCLWGQDRVGW
jgi:hypothetical protein